MRNRKAIDQLIADNRPSEAPAITDFPICEFIPSRAAIPGSIEAQPQRSFSKRGPKRKREIKQYTVVESLTKVKG